MKNYNKIYNRLIKEIKVELDDHYKCISKTSIESNNQLIELIENKYGIAVLNWLLSILPEIEGKECQMILMKHKEFKQWKKRISK